MELLDSRRLTGANILWERPGAVIDAAVADERREQLVAAWEVALRERLDALGWHDERSCVRRYEGGVSLALSAPLDALYAATEINEAAWHAAVAKLGGEGVGEASDADNSRAQSGAAANDTAPGEAPDAPETFEAELARLRGEIADEVNPALLALRDAARAHGVSFLSDDDHASVGLGAGSRCWPVGELPAPAEVDWASVHDIPTAMVTGTNGKTTTVRLLASIAEAAGRCVGVSSTDRVRVGSDILEEGDWSGPGGARLVLRDTRTELGLLETARGGMLRRGLAVERCEVSAVLNIGADHLGEWGVGSLEGLAEGKFVVTRVADAVVLNADDPVIVKRAATLDRELIWFSLDAANTTLCQHLAQGGRGAFADDGALWLCRGEDRTRLVELNEVPVTLDGVARYNVANALAAACLAERLGFEHATIRAGLQAFESDRAANPGRLNRFDLGGVQAIVDFAHNPDGVAALFETVNALPAQRRLVLLGQAGDRDEGSIREMARVSWEAKPDLIVIKELSGYLRGREPGEIPALIEAELRAHGANDEDFVHCASELEAVEYALSWSRPGDLLLLLAHDSRDEVLSRLESLEREGWTPKA